MSTYCIYLKFSVQPTICSCFHKDSFHLCIITACNSHGISNKLNVTAPWFLGVDVHCVSGLSDSQSAQSYVFSLVHNTHKRNTDAVLLIYNSPASYCEPGMQAFLLTHSLIDISHLHLPQALLQVMTYRQRDLPFSLRYNLGHGFSLVGYLKVCKKGSFWGLLVRRPTCTCRPSTRVA